ncbi:guanine nucleotide binding protein, alpha subunit [Scleroderma citrinum]
MVFNYDASDPLAVVTAPPPNETAEEKAAREEREAEARRISDQIDEELRADKAALRKHEETVKILLLGQSESGKSTTLKNFRMQFSPEKWAQERTSWRTVIQLNVVRSVNAIADAMERDSSITSRHQKLLFRLSPLRRVEEDLKRMLGTAESRGSSPSSRTVSPKTSREFFVQSLEWRNFLQSSSKNRGSHSQTTREGVNIHNITEVIAQCADDIQELWGDEIVQGMVHQREIRLEDSASFFLDASARIAARDYQPTDDDVLRARLRTLGVQEHELYIDEDGKTQTWKIYDVGGSRTQASASLHWRHFMLTPPQRRAWLPYFEQVNAIIFLAPISCFDERLTEDPRVNRLEDSFILWKAICSSQLLLNTTFIIFLNKRDILEKKIADGILIKKYLPSYADRPNETNAIVKYLATKFKETALNQSQRRTCHVYATSVVDMRATAQTLVSVRIGIMKEHLKKAMLL